MTIESIKPQYHKAWKENYHAEYFDTWADKSLGELTRLYESFNEIRLLKQYASSQEGQTLAEVGCATGEFYRYSAKNLPQYNYHGFDISEAALNRAREKFSVDKFFLCPKSGGDLKAIMQEKIGKQVDTLFARDVVLHQDTPFEFLKALIQIPQDMAVLRIRTRDKGATLLDPELSCQYVYGHWAPYMILNTDEVISVIRETVTAQKIHIVKHYMPLGGHHGRYVPKDCFDPETGTAETAVLIKLGEGQTDVVIEDRVDTNPKYTFTDYVVKAIRRLRKTK